MATLNEVFGEYDPEKPLISNRAKYAKFCKLNNYSEKINNINI